MIRRKWTKQEIEEYRKIHSGVFYYNKDDSNLFVPKQFGIGFTFNWANPSMLFIAFLVIGFVVRSVFFK